MLNGSVSSISLIISFVRGIFFSFIYCPKKTQTCVYLRALMIQGFGWNQRWKVDAVSYTHLTLPTTSRV